MSKRLVRTSKSLPGFLLAATAVFAAQAPTASAAIIFDIEGNYMTILGYTFCFWDCGYEHNAVRLVRQPAVPPVDSL